MTLQNDHFFLFSLFIVESITDATHFPPITLLHPVLTPSQAFTTPLPVSMGYAFMHVSTLVRIKQKNHFASQEINIYAISEFTFMLKV